MSPLWLFALAAFFGYLAYDAFQFRHSANHRVWAVSSASGRAVGADPLSVREQGTSRSQKYTGADGIPGLHWVFLVMALACAAAGAYFWIFD